MIQHNEQDHQNGSVTELSQARNLQMGNTDYLASSLKAILGMIPVIGSLLVELIGTIIPNQRDDRMAKFAVELSQRLSKLSEDFIRSQLTNENYTDLLQEGLAQAIRSVTQERREYIASLIANGISSLDKIDRLH